MVILRQAPPEGWAHAAIWVIRGTRTHGIWAKTWTARQGIDHHESSGMGRPPDPHCHRCSQSYIHAREPQGTLISPHPPIRNRSIFFET